MNATKVEPGAGLAELARFAERTRLDALPADVVRQAQACLLYGLAVGIASVQAVAPRRAADALDWEYGDARGAATRLLDGRRVPVGAAAFANGVLLHARIQEDAHPAGHVGVVVVPAALAVAERLGASGAELLCGIVAGYETALRIGRDHAGDASTRGFRTTSIYGAFGAAAATARLMRLSGAETAHALALAAGTACGVREFVNAGTEEYALHAGHAARSGIEAAACAKAGADAAPTSLEGSAGFYRSYSGADKDYARRLTEDLGQTYEFREVTYKPYPTCQFHRGVVHGVLELRAQALSARLRRMTIRMHPFEADFVGVRYAGPFRTFSQTFMSAPFCAALAWTKGAVGYAGLHRYDDADVLDCAARIEVVSDLSTPRYQPRVAVVDDGGATREWVASPDSGIFRLTWEAAVHMAGVLCAEVGLPRDAVEALVRAADGIAEAPDAAALVTAARVAASGAVPREDP
jgi:2-methylcitrate dehydratase PrpD